MTLALSRRELEVVRGMMDGLLAKEIAADMGISPRTVETHRARAALKLGARTGPHLVALAMASGQLK